MTSWRLYKLEGIIMDKIINLLTQKGIKKANKTLITTAIELAKYQQSNFDALDMAVKRVAYQLNISLIPDIDSYWQKQLKNENISDQDDLDLPVLTPKQLELQSDFKRAFSDYLKSLPCFFKYSKAEQNQILEDFNSYLDNLQGTPDKVNERKALLNVQYMAECLINNFNVIKVKNGGVCDLAYWNGETYLTGDNEIDSLIKKVNLLTYNNLNIKDCRKGVDTRDVCDQLEIMTETKNIAPASYIPCLNGIVHLDTNNPSKLELLQFDPYIITTYQYQGYYKPVSEIPLEVRNKVNRYFELIANKDRETPQHYQEIKDRIFEYCSTILYRGQLFKSYGFFQGDADAGKTSFIENCIFSILPPNSYNVIKLNKLDNRFELYGLKGQLANLFDEFNLDYGSKGIAQQEALKTIVSGGLKLRVENKNVKASNIKCDARVFISLNSYMNLTDEATAKKMVYIPMHGSLDNVDASKYYVTASCSQDEKDYIFATLLSYLQQVFINRAQTGRYFKQSDYIDKLQKDAELKTNELANSIEQWLNDCDPFKDYPKGQLLNDATKKRMKLSFYIASFRSYQNKLPENEQIDPSSKAFRTVLLKIIPFNFFDSVKDTLYSNSGVTNVLLPKKYKGQVITNYQVYKTLILADQQALATSNNIIEMNTERALKEVQAENLSNPYIKQN